MKVQLDTRTCNCWDAACEAHFGWHFLRGEMTPVDCTVAIIDDGKEEITFLIKDRDGSDKILVVTDENRAEAHDAWRIAWEKQQAEKSTG
jgi:hypothetical protein